jgi:hypothetical protein
VVQKRRFTAKISEPIASEDGRVSREGRSPIGYGNLRYCQNCCDAAASTSENGFFALEYPYLGKTWVLFFMTLTFKSGDMFSEPVDALVNTVNCVGVMGKGVALEFKRRWPENIKFTRLLVPQNSQARANSDS